MSSPREVRRNYTALVLYQVLILSVKQKRDNVTGEIKKKNSNKVRLRVACTYRPSKLREVSRTEGMKKFENVGLDSLFSPSSLCSSSMNNAKRVYN